jgi:hypothetical protein
MQTVAEIVDAFGRPTAFAKVISRGTSTASEMKRNGSIPGRYWEVVVHAARARGIGGVTLECLARLHARQCAAGFAPGRRPRGGPSGRAGQDRAGQDRAGIDRRR